MWKNTVKSTLQRQSLTLSFSTCSPKYRGKYCLGERRRYKTCNIPPCGQEEPTFRHVQCSHFNTLPYKGKFYKWETVFNRGEQAKPRALMLSFLPEMLIIVADSVCHSNPLSQPLWAALPTPEWKLLRKDAWRRHRRHAVLRGQQKQRYVHQRHL